MTNLYRHLTSHMPDGTAPGQPAASAAPAAGTPAAPTPAPAAGDAPPAWFAAYTAQVEQRFAAVEGGKQKAEADANAAAAAKLTVEQQLAAQRDEFAKYRAQGEKTQIKAEIADAAGKYTFASPPHRDAAIALFSTHHRTEVKDGAVLAFGLDGKPQHVDQAFGAWAKGTGAIFVAAAAQPGPGAPGAAPPAGTTTQKRPKEMTPAEFAAFKKSGVTAKLTNDARSPSVTFMDRTVPRLVERREALLGAARGISPLK